MGAKDSKPSCINYEDACKRVTDSELRRIREAFKRLAGTSGTVLSKNSFIQDVLGEGVPSVLADWLYTACGGTSKGIAFRELLCGLVLLTKGTLEEKIKFLWTLYCNDAGTHMIKADFLRCIQVESTYQSHTTTNGYTSTLPNRTISLFGQTDRVSFEQFKSWILIHKDATVLSKWLLLDACVNLSSELETPTFYQSLAGVTHLEETDISDLEKVFWLLKGQSATEQLDLESLSPLISPPVPKSALAGVFSSFDENHDGHIDFKELCCGVSAACRGPTVERSKFCFKVFDVDRDGVLNFCEIKQMIDILTFVAKEANSNLYKTVTSEKMLIDLYKRVKSPTEEIVDNQIQEFKFSQEDFLIWSIESSVNLVQPFLDLLFEVCHIVLGLRPQCKHLEADIVKGWLSREVRRGYKVGQFWYLVSADWWQQWLQFTQSCTNSPCTYCKNSTRQNLVDEAMICDESFTSNSTESMGDLLGAGDSSSLGSGSSGISYGRHLNGPPGHIDNACLIAVNPHKTIQTLTGEGGRLKKDLPLVQHRDFELVPDSLWKALSQWYGGSLPLPRQVIQPPNSPDVELELYPMNLRVFRHQNQTNPQQQPSNTSWGSIAGGYGALTSGSYSTVSVPAVPQTPKQYLAYTAAFSRLATVKQMAEFLCQRLKLKSEDIRLWHYLGSANNAGSDFHYLLEEENMTLQDLSFSDNDQILLEVRNKDLTWPEELGSLSLTQNSGSNANNLERRATVASITSQHPAGATGLHNLGNTCFMNAALQVLFNTQPLTQYFRQNMHLFELNTTNKFGTKGALAVKYSELLKEVWTASTRSIAPLKLRFCMTKHAPQFSGGGQHDSQELLDWLLDSLHEDLNRVTEKPYSELKDSNGRADTIVASEAWNQHHARNQSIIVDLFYGQLKSKVSCLGCSHDSVRFDAFSLLSLPLPLENYVYCEVLVTLLDGTVPIKYGLRLNSESKYWDMKKSLSELCSLEPERMLVAELANSQIRTVLMNEQKVKPSTACELYIYELPKPDMIPRSRAGSELGINIEKGLKDIQRNPDVNQLTTTSVTTVLSSSSSVSSSSGDDVVQMINLENSLNNSQALKCNRRSVATSKVSRCFGNTLCMPPNMLCFKHTSEISTSPDSTFMQMTPNHRKTVSTTNLLNDSFEDQATKSTTLNCSSESDEITIPNNINSDSNNDIEHDKFVKSDKDDSNVVLSAINNNSKPQQPNLSPRKISFSRKNNYLIALHRKLSRQDTYFLSHHKSKPGLFGVPLLIPCYEGVTNKDLYCSVWLQVSRLLSPLPPTPPDQSNHATDCDDSLGYDFPFTLRAVCEGGRACALCPWSRFCRGCEIPCNDDLLLQGPHISTTSTPNLSSREQTPTFRRKNYSTSSEGSQISTSNRMTFINPNQIYIAIDWDPTALHLRYQSTRERLWTEHESVVIYRKQQTEPVDLDHCLRAFTSEEKLEQWYHCSHCNGKQPATKKLQIWKLPPVLIVHLKRFNYVNNKWVKSQKVVNFPYENFDPTPYLASVPQETILRHRELLDVKEDAKNRDCSEEINEFDREISKINENSEDDESAIAENEVTLNASAPPPHKEKEKKMSVMGNSNPAKTRQRLVSTSLTKTPVIDGEFTDFHDHKLKQNQDAFDLNYQLYAAVCHSGMLNGGHYIAYATNPNGAWYCYNDSSCREIQGRPNIDPSTAYLLFYERKNLDYSPYLPPVDGKPIPKEQLLLEVDDSDNELKKMCVLS